MSLKMNIPKRILILFMVSLITFNSVFFSYSQTVKSAEWVGGVVAAVGGGPVLTALLIGGVVVAGGVALYELSQTDASDHRNFISGIKQGFNEFVSNQEKQIALENNSSLTDQEASDIGVANARETVNNFFDNAIETSKNTVSNVKKKSLDYWNEYSKQISNVADNGITEGGNDMTPTTVINTYTHNYDSSIEVLEKGVDNVGANTINFNDNYYINKGNYVIPSWNNGVLEFNTDEREYVSSIQSEVIIPFMLIINDKTNLRISSTILRFYYNKNNNTLTNSINIGWTQTNINNNSPVSIINQIINHTNFPCVIVDNFNYSTTINTLAHNISTIAVSAGVASTPVWLRTINSALTDTKFGSAIRTGRREVVNTGDYITGIFKEDSVPVKKSTLAVNEGTVSGSIGWDIPAGNVWDDVFSGNKPYADVVGQTGAIGVPDDVITGVKNGDTVIDYPDDALIQDTSDYPDTDTDDDDLPEEIPERPQSEVFEEQGGTFYPNAFDLTMIFPFCIPFDIIYLIDKFDVGGSNAPVITIPIKYPSVIQSSMGTDHYDVVIDFEDFIVLRNIIRIFLLLLFIVGLMKITRDLIRG